MLVEKLRPVIRILRKKTVLAIIFCFSFSFFMYNVYNKDYYGRVIQSSNDDHMTEDHDYGDLDSDRMRLFAMRRGGQHPDLKDTHPETGAAGDPLDNVIHNHLLDTNRLFNENITEPQLNSEVIKTKTCRNSIQGKVLISDDRGYACLRKDLSPGGCCDPTSPNSKQYSCETCSDNGCCAIYEYCISCCLEPSKKPILSRVINGGSSGQGFRKNFIYESLTDHFEFCLAKCRTSSQSVKHENSYRDPKAKHCFGDGSTQISQVSSHAVQGASSPAEHKT